MKERGFKVSPVTVGLCEKIQVFASADTHINIK